MISGGERSEPPYDSSARAGDYVSQATFYRHPLCLAGEKTPAMNLFRISQKLERLASRARRLKYNLLGARIGNGVNVGGKLHFMEPRAVAIGNNVNLRGETWLYYTGPFDGQRRIVVGDNVFIGQGCEFNIIKGIQVSSNCLIASGCKFIDGDHGIARDKLIRDQVGWGEDILLEEDVWLGANVTILKGVSIGRGAVVAAGAVVTKSIPPYEIWGGVPARKLKERQ